MHKLYEYACEELEKLEGKAENKGLTGTELEYADKLTELKKNILKIEMLEDEGYSAEYRDDMRHSYRSRNSYARNRNARRDGMGRYSRNYSMATEDLIEQLEEIKDSAPDDMSRREVSKLIDKMRQA